MARACLATDSALIHGTRTPGHTRTNPGHLSGLSGHEPGQTGHTPLGVSDVRSGRWRNSKMSEQPKMSGPTTVEAFSFGISGRS